MPVLALFIALLSLLMPLPALAQGELSLSPAIHHVTLEQRQQPASYTVFVTSNLPRPEQVTFRVLPVSGVDALGKPIIDHSAAASEVISQQVMLNPPQTTLLPQETVEIEVIVHSQFLPPGGTYALITAALEGTDNNDTGTQASVVPVIASFLAIRNPNGEERRLSIGGLAWPKIPLTTNLHPQIEVSLENQGNVHVEPHGLVELTDTFNRLVSRGQLNENAHLVLPSQEKVLGVSLQSLRPNFPLGLYVLKASGADELGQTPFISTRRFVYISPWIVGLLVLVCLIVWINYRSPDLKRFKRRTSRKAKDNATRTSVADLLDILEPK